MPPVHLPDLDTLWNFDDPAATELAFRQVLLSATTSGDVSYMVRLLTQIARTEGLQKKFAAAHQTLNRAEALLPNVDAATNTLYLLERGRVFNTAGQGDEALRCFEQAWELASAENEAAYAVDAAHMIAIVQHDSAAQLDWNRKALALAESSSDPRARKWLGALFNNVGWNYHDSGDYEQALNHFEKALSARLEAGKEGPIHIAKWTVGRALRSLGRVDAAMNLQRELMMECESAGKKDGYVYEELAECLLMSGREEESRRYFELAYDELCKDAHLARHESARLERLRQLAQNPAG